MTSVTLIFGGPSAEHDVSLVSAKNIYQVLKTANTTVTLLGITKNKVWKLVPGEALLSTSFDKPLDLETCGTEVQLQTVDQKVFVVDPQTPDHPVGPIGVALPVIHGPYGEDGQLQKELNAIGLEFVGSDDQSCQGCFDKAKTKDILNSKGIPQVPHITFSDLEPSFNEVKSQLGLPVFVKPASMGSSIGISKVRNEEEFTKAIAEARIHDKKIVIEQGVQARELECALLETGSNLKVSGLGEVKPNHEFYSYEAKYLDPSGAELIIPAVVDAEIVTKIQELALQCFRELGCRDYARADFFLTEDGTIYFNEINTHPGFTNISQFPMLWRQQGIEYKDLILKLIDQATLRQKDR